MVSMGGARVCTDMALHMHRRRVRYAPTPCWVCTGVVLGMHRRRFRSVGCGKRQLELANALERGKDIHCGPPSSVWPRLRRGERRRTHISCSGPDRLRYLMCMGGVLRRGARSVPRPSLLNGEAARPRQGTHLHCCAASCCYVCVCGHVGVGASCPWEPNANDYRPGDAERHGNRLYDAG